MSLSQNESLERCGFKLSGGKWRKQLNYEDPDGSVYTLFQINGRVGWSVDIEKEGTVKTESAGKMKGAPVYPYIEAALSELDKAADGAADPIDNLKAGGFDLSGEEEKSTVEDATAPCDVIQERIVDEDKLAKLDEIMDGKVEPVRTPAKRERTIQKMPAVIPVDMRSKQIQELTIQDIKDNICPTATEQEAFMFLKLCQARNLNPFLNEAYLIKYGDKTTMTVGKEAFMRRAEAHPQFDGFEAGIIIQKPDGELERREGTFMLKNEALVGGWAKIYRKDRRQPFVSEVALHEYDLKKALWVSKPATMIRKVAIVQGKREAFPSEFGGMYDKAEVDTGIIDAEYMEVEA